MRDDIHKRAPGGRRWKLLVRACSRDADRAVRAPLAAAAAVRGALAESSVGSIFRPLLVAQQGLFPEVARAAKFLQQAVAGQRVLGELDRRALQALERLARTRPLGEALAREAIGIGVRETIVAWTRELDAHVAMNHPKDRKELMGHVGREIAAVPLDALVAEATGGRVQSPPRRLKEDFNVDQTIG